MNYYDNQELVNITLLEEFNEKVKWFESITATTRGTSHDAEATDKKGRKTIIELKERGGTLNKYVNVYKSVFIEPLKISHMSKMQEVSGFTNHEQRLYINFVDDGVIIFNMNKPHTIIYKPNVEINDPGTRQKKHCDRFAIPIEEGIIYKKIDGKYEILTI